MAWNNTHLLDHNPVHRKSGHIWLGLCSRYHKAEFTVLAGFVSRGFRKGFTSSLIKFVGKTQFFVVFGLTSLIPFWLPGGGHSLLFEASHSSFYVAFFIFKASISMLSNFYVSNLSAFIFFLLLLLLRVHMIRSGPYREFPFHKFNWAK